MQAKVYLVGSGKGGVGKSTVSVNLAIALGKTGQRVGLLDADIFGPSIPIMMGLRRLTPQTVKVEEKERVLPFEKFGIKTISIGSFLEESQAGVWRGPLISNLLSKLLNDVDWGELDTLLIDLPPGTGDVPITLSQLCQISGALIVTTPQEVAVLDAMKMINALDQLQIPLTGIIENMAGFTTSDKTHHLFGRGRGRLLAERFSTPLLGSLPFLPLLQEGSDEGIPPAFSDAAIGTLFVGIAKQLQGLAMGKGNRLG